MLNINKTIDGEKEVFELDGKLDTITSRDFMNEISEIPDSIKELVFDFEKLVYISSAGIRTMLTALKEMEDRDGELKLVNVSETVMEVLDIVGISGDFTIE